MIVPTTQISHSTTDRLRLMEPARDLGTVADLIAEGFADELDERGKSAIREMRWMARLWPFLWWWAQADPSFREAFNGFVWEEPGAQGKHGHVVGNVSLNRAPGSRQRWIICNIVVKKGYRGKGIGRKLTEAAVSQARDLGAVGALLQVHQDNAPALQIYTNLGFQETTGETEMRLEAVGAVAVLDAPGYRFRAWRPGDRRAAQQLVHLATPSTLQWLRPVRANQYQADWWARFGEWLAGLAAARKTFRLVAIKGDELTALMTITAAFRQGEHLITLLVHPDHTGAVEPALISRALHFLAGAPLRPIRATIFKEADAAHRVLRDYGFEKKRTLLTLYKDFEQRVNDARG